jgi:hypothetical protein
MNYRSWNSPYNSEYGVGFYEDVASDSEDYLEVAEGLGLLEMMYQQGDLLD